MNRLARVSLNLGIVATVAGLAQFHATVVYDNRYGYVSTHVFPWTVAYMGLLALTAYGFGLPDLARRRREAIGASIAACVASMAAISAAQLLLGTPLMPRFVLFATPLVLVPWFWMCADFSHDWRERRSERDRALLVSVDPDPDLEFELARGGERAGVLVGHMHPTEARPDGRLPRPLVDRADAEGVGVLVLDRESQNDPALLGQIAELHERGVRIRTRSLFYEEWLGKLPTEELERVSLMFDIGELHRARYARVRRVVDIVLASAGLVALGLITPIVVVGNLVGNRGSLFYRQPRVGQFGHEFTILKFRTMVAAPEADTSWTTTGDHRVTTFGGLLRRSHLDELPQVLNILRGELSVVGPRPEQPHYVTELTDKLPFYQLRHLVRPGLTGWAQVKAGYAASDDDALEKLQYEFFYLRHQCLSLDARIVVRTVRAVLGRAGR